MRIEVLGTGCAKCRRTKKLLEKVIADLDLSVELVEVDDIDEIVSKGVMVTPAVFLDDRPVLEGRVPDEDEIRRWLLEGKGNENVEKTEECSCMAYLREQARSIKKKSSLIRVTCRECGLEFLSSREKDYCFDCEKKRNK